MRKPLTLILLLTAAIIVLTTVNLTIGSVSIPAAHVAHILTGGDGEPEIWQNIIWKSRLPQVLTAIVAGAGLAVSGLEMQTVFHNPWPGRRYWAFPTGRPSAWPSSCCCQGGLAAWHSRGWATWAMPPCR